jgi:Zn-finger nucleic acid-binding protein
MECPRCILEMQLSVKNNEEVCECPGCKGLWLDAEIIGNIFDLSMEKECDCNMNNVEQPVTKNLQNETDYYFYKKSFTENANPDEVVGFE